MLPDLRPPPPHGVVIEVVQTGLKIEYVGLHPLDAARVLLEATIATLSRVKLGVIHPAAPPPIPREGL